MSVSKRIKKIPLDSEYNAKLKFIQDFADKHKIEFERKGEVGFGRPCVGLINKSRDNYIDYNPHQDPNYTEIKEVYDERFYEISPDDAYHKHSCFAVLVKGETDADYKYATEQLYDWVVKLNELNVQIKQYDTGATGLQVVISGKTGLCFIIPE